MSDADLLKLRQASTEDHCERYPDGGHAWVYTSHASRPRITTRTCHLCGYLSVQPVLEDRAAGTLRSPHPSAGRLTWGRLQVYLEPRDGWLGVYVSDDAVYVLPLPVPVVFRWRLRRPLRRPSLLAVPGGVAVWVAYLLGLLSLVTQ